MKTSSQFIFQTRTNSSTVIDLHSDPSLAVSMHYPSDLVNSEITAISSLRVGAVSTSITFRIQAKHPLYTNDILVLNIPTEFTLNSPVCKYQT